MNETERTAYLLLGILMVICLLIFVVAVTSLKSEFDECKGLESVVERIWTGEPCEESL